MKPSEYFGKKLRELRQHNKLTAGQLASYLNCSPSLIYNIERGLNRPQPELIVHAAHFFGVTTDYLLQEEVLDNEKILIELWGKLNNKSKLFLFYLINLLTGND